MKKPLSLSGIIYGIYTLFIIVVLGSYYLFYREISDFSGIYFICIMISIFARPCVIGFILKLIEAKTGFFIISSLCAIADAFYAVPLCFLCLVFYSTYMFIPIAICTALSVICLISNMVSIFK